MLEYLATNFVRKIKKGLVLGILDKLEVDFEYDLIDEFVGHFGFMCDSLEELCLGLEKPEKYENDVQELFRIFHNIKSATSYFKLEPMIKLATLVEDILEEARVKKGPATQEFIDWLLVVSDQLGKWRADLEQNKEQLTPFNHMLVRIPLNITLEDAALDGQKEQ